MPFRHHLASRREAHYYRPGRRRQEARRGEEIQGPQEIAPGHDGRRQEDSGIPSETPRQAEQAAGAGNIDVAARLRLAIEAADLGIWDWDILTNEMTWSDRAKAIAGIPSGAPVTFAQIRDATHPEDLPRTSQMAQRALDPNSRSREPYEYRLLRPDGSIRWVLAHGEAVFAGPPGAERAVRYTGTIQDITQRKRAELSLRESEARLRLAVDAARLSIWEYDSTTGTLTSTPELNRMLGFPPDEPLVIADVNARYYPGDREIVQKAGQTALAAGERYMQAEFRYVWPDGSVRWLVLRAEILFSPANVPNGALGVVMDITEEKQAEEHRQLLLAELQHRVNNTLALVGAIANRTFGADAIDGRGEALAVFTARLAALGKAHGALNSERWRSADLAEIVATSLEPFRFADRFTAAGPKVSLDSRRALALALALNELATNATKYGALSNATGRVEMRWQLADKDGRPELHFHWSESGGPLVSPPKRTSFGTRLIREKLAQDFGGDVAIAYHPTGVVCTLRGSLTDAR